MKTTTRVLLATLSVGVLMAVSYWASAAPPIQVTAADPSTTTQGTLSLDVAVSGSGFDSSASVAFLVTGTTNPGGITVKKVNVTGPKKLIATIDVADVAAIANFDIQVTQSGGRKGKGTSLFAVQAKVADACATAGLDFPAFAYWTRQGNTPSKILVADSTGVCSRLLTETSSSPTHLTFSYPIVGSP